jgi:1-acyl-sn-glycerol-3-phosphate acyltransferase
MAAGLGADSVVPSLLGRVVRAYGEMPTRLQEGIGSVLKSGNDLWDPATWEGLSYLMRSSLEMKLEAMRRRRQGLYEVDEFGLDDEYLENVRPLMRFLYHKWFRVTVTGLEHVPATGRTLFVANHSGVLPYDGAMIAAAIWEEHPSPRLVRALHLEWFVGVPFVAPFLQKTGQVMAIPENGERLLERDHLVTVFPEGLKGVGKLFKDRYQLARFGRGGFIRMALRARAPIIPVSVVGAEEIHPVLFQADFISKPLGLPHPRPPRPRPAALQVVHPLRRAHRSLRPRPRGGQRLQPREPALGPGARRGAEHHPRAPQEAPERSVFQG